MNTSSNGTSLQDRLVDEAAGKLDALPEPGEFLDTDMANARRFARLHGHDVRFTAQRGWLAWDAQRWAPDEKGVRVQQLAKNTALGVFDEIKYAADRKAMVKHAQWSQSNIAINAMISLVRSEPGILASLDTFDADPMLLNVANGTLNLRDGTLGPHRPEDLITRLANVSYDPAADHVLWDEFVNHLTGGDEELYRYLRRLTGYLLTGLATEQVLHFFYGLGANGKTVFCEIIQALLGDYAIVVSPELVMQRRHSGIPNDVARLRGVRVAMMNETSQGSRFDEAKLKDLTGGDMLTGRFMRQEFFDFSPTHKLVIRGNHKPVLTGTDEGIWRRLRLVPFAVTIPPDQQDRQLVQNMRAELPGILRWAVHGCLEWQQDGLKPPAIITDAVLQYREESDTLGHFISERCQERKLGQITSSAFFSAYKSYAEEAGERWIPSKDLPAEMIRRGFFHKRGTGGHRLFLGLEFNVAIAERYSE